MEPVLSSGSSRFTSFLIIIIDTTLIPFDITVQFPEFEIETQSKGTVKNLVIGLLIKIWGGSG